MRRRSLYAACFALLGLFVIYGAVRGAGDAADRAAAREEGAGERTAPRFFGATGAFGHGDATREGVDPYAPPGLPAGVTIDPESGWMTGLSEVSPVEGAWLRWRDLGGPTYVGGVDDVPAPVRELAGRRVAIAGFLKAIYEFEDIRTFLLVGSHLACCFGTFPGPAGVVEVSLAKGEPAAKRMVAPILVSGTLSFRPVFDTYGGRRRVALLFRIDDARIRKLVP